MEGSPKLKGMLNSHLYRDKTDQVNGVKHKLMAFERFLSMYPEWKTRVVLIQVTIPPPIELPKINSQITEQVSKINTTYGTNLSYIILKLEN